MDTNNQIYIARKTVLVGDLSAQRNMLCDVYGYLKDRLLAQDSAGAAMAYQPAVRSKYQGLFDALGSNMPSAAPMLGYIINGMIAQGYAEMTIVRDNADQTRNGFPLRMTHGADGVWRIAEM